MGIWKIAYIELKRRKIKTVILLLILTLLFSGVLSALTLLTSAQKSKTDILAKIGATVTLDYAKDYEKPVFSSALRDKLENTENVIGINQHYSDFVLPLNFENDKSYSGQNPYSQEIQIEHDQGFENNIVFDGNIRVDLIDTFRNGIANIVSGSFPTEQSPGALISRQLSEQNALELGDILSVSAYGKEYSVEIVGIYETNAQFQVSTDNIIGPAIFAHSPYNRVYVDIDTLCDVFNINRDTMAISVYVDSPSTVLTVGSEIRGMDLDWDIIQLIDTTDTAYSSVESNIESITNISMLFIVIFMVISCIAVVLVTNIWANAYRYESGIYLALGASKWRTIAQLLISMLYAAIPALIVAVCSAKKLATLALNYQNLSTSHIEGAVSQFVTGTEIGGAVTIKQLDFSVYGTFTVIAIGVVLLACLFPAYSVFRSKPREILSKR